MADIGRITRAVDTPGTDLGNFRAIDPVISNNREIGVEVKRGPLDASATYFWSSSDKGQLLIALSNENFQVQRQRVEIEGLESIWRCGCRSTGCGCRPATHISRVATTAIPAHRTGGSIPIWTGPTSHPIG